MKKTLPKFAAPAPTGPAPTPPAPAHRVAAPARRPWPAALALGAAALLGAGLLAPHAHSAGGPVAVQVANLSTAPAQVQNVDSVARQPFGKRLDINFSGGSGNQTFTVPAGKRLVITYISSDVGVKTGASTLVDLATIVNGAEVESHLPAENQGVILGQQVYAVSSPMSVTADPGSTVTIAFLDSDSSASGGAIVGVYGYLTSV